MVNGAGRSSGIGAGRGPPNSPAWREPQALQAYDQKLCKDIFALVLRNRGAGPFATLGLVDERCCGVFDNIDEVVPRPSVTSSWPITSRPQALPSRR